jgi:hypothetical protein
VPELPPKLSDPPEPEPALAAAPAAEPPSWPELSATVVPAAPPLWPFAADRDDDVGWLLPDALDRAAAGWLRSIGPPGAWDRPVAALPLPLACLKPEGGFLDHPCH